MGKKAELKHKINMFLYDKQNINKKVVSVKKSFDEVSKLISGNKK